MNSLIKLNFCAYHGFLVYEILSSQTFTLGAIAMTKESLV